MRQTIWISMRRATETAVTVGVIFINAIQLISRHMGWKRFGPPVFERLKISKIQVGALDLCDS